MISFTIFSIFAADDTKSGTDVADDSVKRDAAVDAILCTVMWRALLTQAFDKSSTDGALGSDSMHMMIVDVGTESACALNIKNEK